MIVSGVAGVGKKTESLRLTASLRQAPGDPREFSASLARGSRLNW